MTKASKRIIIALALAICGSSGVYLLQANKYYVKRFIKEHEALYAIAQKVADIKHGLLNSRLNKEAEQNTESHRANKPSKWSLLFDAAQPGKSYQRFWGNLGYESFKNGILSSKNRRLFELMQEANARTKGAFRYLRAHNLFSNGRPPWGEGCDIYREDGQGQAIYHWTVMDEVFDEIIRFGFKPIVELGFMPDALASIPERRQQWGRANISPPKDYDKWQELVRATVAHWLDRYGRAELETWYFEVWNEPDLGWLFWIEDQDPKRKPYGDVQEYRKLYDYTVAGAKQAFPDIRIGGPATAGGMIDQFLENAYLEENLVNGQTGTPVAFVSSHAYGNIAPGNGLRQKPKKNIMDAIHWKISRASEHDHRTVREAMASLPFLLTETGPSARSGAYYNDRYVAAWWAKMVDAIFHIGEKWGDTYQPEEVVFWSSHQVAKSFGTEKGIASALETSEGTRVFKRPSFNAFEALGHLSDELIRLRSGAQFGDPVHALATRDQDRSVEILIYHLDESDYECAKQDTQNIYLVVENLPFEKFQVQWYVIDETHSNGYSAWKAMGQPRSLTKKAAEELGRRDDLALAEPVSVRRAADRRFEKKFNLQSNSLVLFILSQAS